MNGRYRNIYQLARNNAGLTQEQASEKLNISTRAVGKYESGEIIPNADIVHDMISLYKANWLGYEHLRQSSDLGMQVLPTIDFSDIAKSVLVLQKESSDVENVKNCMVSIACDNRVDTHELNRWDEITKEVKELAGAALSVVYSR